LIWSRKKKKRSRNMTSFLRGASNWVGAILEGISGDRIEEEESRRGAKAQRNKRTSVRERERLYLDWGKPLSNDLEQPALAWRIRARPFLRESEIKKGSPVSSWPAPDGAISRKGARLTQKKENKQYRAEPEIGGHNSGPLRNISRLYEGHRGRLKGRMKGGAGDK